jgi:hypothetical protein
MKTSVVKFFAGSGIRLAVLSLLFLGLAGVCMAQASAAPARPAAPAAAAPQAQPAAQPGQTAPSSKPAPRGTQEGIQIHGHWTVEVRNPDGKLVTHREFENGLANPPNAGPALLSALLTRGVTAGSWEVNLQDTAGDFNLWIDEANSQAASACAINAGYQGTNCSATPLTVTGAVVGPSNSLVTTTITLKGSGVAPANTPSTDAISLVETVNFICGPTVSPQNCLNASGGNGNNSGGYVSFPLTSRILDGLNGDPAAVPITAGQSIAVTVVISFGSGS